MTELSVQSRSRASAVPPPLLSPSPSIQYWYCNAPSMQRLAYEPAADSSTTWPGAGSTPAGSATRSAVTVLQMSPQPGSRELSFTSAVTVAGSPSKASVTLMLSTHQPSSQAIGFHSNRASIVSAVPALMELFTKRIRIR